MNCEKCQALISDLLDGTLSKKEQTALNLHLEECLGCAQVRSDLESIVLFCRSHRGEYTAPPDQNALWLRIRNIVEAEQQSAALGATSSRSKGTANSWSGWMGRSWQVSMPQLAASVAAIVVVVSLATFVGVRRWETSSQSNLSAAPLPVTSSATSREQDRLWQQQQTLNYWNQRVELNKARWNPEMREAFDRNLRVIDQAVNDSLNELKQNPHDEVSEEMLNAAIHEKLSLLKEFAEL